MNLNKQRVKTMRRKGKTAGMERLMLSEDETENKKDIRKGHV